MALTTFERGMAEGYRRASWKGQREIIQVLLEDRFGSLHPDVLKRLETWPGEELPALGVAMLHRRSLAELGLTRAPTPT